MQMDLNFSPARMTMLSQAIDQFLRTARTEGPLAHPRRIRRKGKVDAGLFAQERRQVSVSGQRLFAGKVIEVERRTTEGFLRGSAAIEGERHDRVRIDFQNEWTVVWREGAPLATTPELICVLDSDTGEAIGTEMVRYGQRVTVIVLPAPEIFLTPRGLELVGPRAFGYDIDFRSALAS